MLEKVVDLLSAPAPGMMLGHQRPGGVNGALIVRVLSISIETFTARDVLAEAESDGERSPREDAKGFLRSFLSEGPAAAKEVQAAARGEGISLRTLERAKAELRIRTFRVGFGKDSVFQWELSENNTIDRHAHHRSPLSGVAVYGDGGGQWGGEAGNAENREGG